MLKVCCIFLFVFYTQKMSKLSRYKNLDIDLWDFKRQNANSHELHADDVALQMINKSKAMLVLMVKITDNAV